MKIQQLPDQFNDFFEFNKKIFPSRRLVEEYFRHFYCDNPLLADQPPVGYLAYGEQNEIAGQFLLTPVSWSMGENSGMGYWGCDFYVDQAWRSSGVGAVLAMKAIQGHKPYFTIGASEDAKKISLSLRAKHAGDLLKFVRLLKISALIKLALSGNDDTSAPIKFKRPLPKSVAVGRKRFHLCDKPFDWPLSPQPGLLSFGRDASFISWRFFNSIHQYYIYKSDKGSDYFVVRPLAWKGLHMLQVVDYRTDMQYTQTAKALFKAARKIAKQIGADGLMTFSSHSHYDQVLKKLNYLKIGRPQPILTNLQTEWNEQNIANRKAVLATAADCDLDYNLDNAS